MEVASLSPVPVGVLSWNSPDPSVTLIVKATFDVEADGSVSLVPDQPPISLDLATGPQDLGLHGAELYYGTDFAPKKGAVDVLVVGHARAAYPTTHIPIRLRVGALDLALMAVSEVPAATIPLSERYVRRVPTDPATAVRLAPAGSSVMGWISRTVAPGFDFAVFNTAPHRHRLTFLLPDTVIETRGLLRRGDRPVQLAGVTPRVFHVADRSSASAGEPVPMTCDTLWLDTDREHVTLVWRGQVARSAPGARPFVVVKLHGPGDVSWRDMSRGLGRAAWFSATEAHDLRRANDAPLSQSEPTLTAMRALDPLDMPESTTTRLAKKILATGEERRIRTLVDPTKGFAPPLAEPMWRRAPAPWQAAAGGTVEMDDVTLADESRRGGPPSDPIPLAPPSESAAPIPLAPKTVRRDDEES